jgi:hypothetical protein
VPQLAAGMAALRELVVQRKIIGTSRNGKEV